MNSFCFGISHQTASVEVRERFTIPDSVLTGSLTRLARFQWRGAKQLFVSNRSYDKAVALAEAMGAELFDLTIGNRNSGIWTFS